MSSESCYCYINLAEGVLKSTDIYTKDIKTAMNEKNEAQDFFFFFLVSSFYCEKIGKCVQLNGHHF